jgi:8-oxo-dGTP pyrophosphatase MutT (NUDIX family)
MLTGVCALVTTIDGYLVLQWRSKYVSEGAANLAATGTGFAQWGKDFGLSFRWPWVNCANREIPDVMRNAALRELREETGIARKHILVPPREFLGAAFNLLHGRDLNFYAHYCANITHREVSRLLASAKDRWEIASLQFVPLEFIDDEGRLIGGFQYLMPRCTRHLRGALYAFAKSGRLANARQCPRVS